MDMTLGYRSTDYRIQDRIRHSYRQRDTVYKVLGSGSRSRVPYNPPPYCGRYYSHSIAVHGPAHTIVSPAPRGEHDTGNQEELRLYPHWRD